MIPSSYENRSHTRSRSRGRQVVKPGVDSSRRSVSELERDESSEFAFRNSQDRISCSQPEKPNMDYSLPSKFNTSFTRSTSNSDGSRRDRSRSRSRSDESWATDDSGGQKPSLRSSLIQDCKPPPRKIRGIRPSPGPSFYGVEFPRTSPVKSSSTPTSRISPKVGPHLSSSVTATKSDLAPSRKRPTDATVPSNIKNKHGKKSLIDEKFTSKASSPAFPSHGSHASIRQSSPQAQTTKTSNDRSLASSEDNDPVVVVISSSDDDDDDAAHKSVFSKTPSKLVQSSLVCESPPASPRFSDRCPARRIIGIGRGVNLKLSSTTNEDFTKSKNVSRCNQQSLSGSSFPEMNKQSDIHDASSLASSESVAITPLLQNAPSESNRNKTTAKDSFIELIPIPAGTKNAANRIGNESASMIDDGILYSELTTPEDSQIQDNKAPEYNDNLFVVIGVVDEQNNKKCDLLEQEPVSIATHVNGKGAENVVVGTVKEDQLLNEDFQSSQFKQKDSESVIEAMCEDEDAAMLNAANTVEDAVGEDTGNTSEDDEFEDTSEGLEAINEQPSNDGTKSKTAKKRSWCSVV